MNYAIYTAVSTAPQTEGDSLTEQERKCRAVASSKNWRDTGLRYIVDGHSRTAYVNLRDAERNIPAIAAALNDAQAGRYHILAIYDYNRLRDLADPIAKTLASYGVQIYSANQPVEPIPPESFNPYAADSEGMMRGLNQIISKWQIADLQRKYKFGMRGRIERGLYGLKFPFGYLKSRPGDKDSPLIADPLPAALLVRLKDSFLSGASLADLERIANASNLSTPRGHKQWRRATIYTMLINPFYAGRTVFGEKHIERDPRTGRRTEIKNPQPLYTAEGSHPALWDWTTHLAILKEFNRRSANDPRKVSTPLAGLLICSVCGRKIWGHVNTYYCHPHVALPKAKALTDIPRQLADFLRAYTPDFGPDSPLPSPAPALADLDRKRKRIEEGYEAGLYDLSSAKAKLSELDLQASKLRDQQAQHAQRIAERLQLTQRLTDIAPLLDDLPAWLNSDDPRKVNYLLRHLLSHITVTPKHHYTFHLIGS